MKFMKIIAIIMIYFLGVLIASIVPSNWQYSVGFITGIVSMAARIIFED